MKSDDVECRISLLLTTTEAAVVDNPNEKNPMAGRMPEIDDMNY